jgi:rubredoxin
MTDYDAETLTFKCRRCGFKYSQLKASPHDYVEPKDKIEFREKPKARKHFPIKRVIGLAFVLIMIGVFLWYTPVIISTVQNFFSQSSYTKMTLVIGQFVTYDHGDNHYGFAWRLLPTDPTNVFYVSTGFQTRVFSATEGATYKDLGLEIKVSEVHSDHIVLLVKPTY